MRVFYQDSEINCSWPAIPSQYHRRYHATSLCWRFTCGNWMKLMLLPNNGKFQERDASKYWLALNLFLPVSHICDFSIVVACLSRNFGRQFGCTANRIMCSLFHVRRRGLPHGFACCVPPNPQWFNPPPRPLLGTVPVVSTLAMGHIVWELGIIYGWECH